MKLLPRPSSSLAILVGLVAGCGLVGCGGGAPQTAGAPGTAVQTTSHEAYSGGEESTGPDDEPFAALMSADASLSDELMPEEQGTLNCRVARDLTESICELAERVCALGDESEDAMERCVDGRGRCERARERTGERCPL